jgi:hypothetical protein
MIKRGEKMRRDVAQSGSALGWGPSGRRFKSGRPDSSERDHIFRGKAGLELWTHSTFY